MKNHQQIIDESEGHGVIYKLTSPSGKSYIGQSIQFKERYSVYRRKKENSIGKKLFNAINKYGGIENFEIEILCKVKIIDDLLKLKSQLDKLETYYIKYFSTFADGYNLTLGGEGSLGRITKEETKIKIGKSNKGKLKVGLITIECDCCGNKIKVKPWLYRLRLKRSKSKKMYCSYLCRDSNRKKKIN